MNNFKDAGAIPKWSRADIGAVVEKGYMRGTPEIDKGVCRTRDTRAVMRAGVSPVFFCLLNIG